ncbi:hypothetical protein [Halorarius halobius]|uniref:hypothetical protein n=1 Tax=Halorarius halobius TaxID=2962671 RepID=UPI0020CD4724|nr:hypothetical protein [Halorarius halobius]
MVDERVRRLHEHLAATAELPLDRTATRWVAEAEAVAADCRHIDNPAVVRDRVREVAELLSNVESTGHPEADDHVAAAAELAADVVDEA